MKNNIGDEKINGKGEEEEIIMDNNEDEVIDNKYENNDEGYEEWEEECEEDEEDYEEISISKGSRNIIIALIVTIVVSLPLGFLLYKYEIRESEKDNIQNVSVKGQKINSLESNEGEVDSKNINNIEKIYDEVHKMANSLIIAEDNQIWGEGKITRKRIKELLKSVEGIDDFLTVEIEKWDKLDFNNAVEVHNYVWKKLGGTVGKAIDLNNEGINEAIAEIDNEE
ncbi:DUF6241 domain-containing protein [Clostridium sardiniense]|uniref:DUF6241 domain-containing protein n=1 Tax=Clostridium sardiniense TaxID=29369 RepID=A0ABS7KWG1_CLOSR|nr:DUF6241 domain-containing protein [Clostridium sardiniense]MBY0755126.1 DUF6241 domain-containing protein [Clostridium sardiniense]MDQ0459016.1 hypothetical protein [Clostridium sardiniense]